MATTIVRASIHPAIGIARLGSSPDEYLLAPQVPHPPPRPVDSSHDRNGHLKREAVEFRIYGYDKNDHVVAELTADNAEIVWTVHVANAKAAWFKFRHAMDLDTLKSTIVERRNPKILDPSERRKLVIDPGSRWISGRSQGGTEIHRFDTGSFKEQPVNLGELRTTAEGRLLFLGGRGVSSSPSGAPPYVDSDSDAFGNAEDWHDDIADGPIDAIVRIDDIDIPTEGAWIASAPPNYAPDIKSWRTLYDLLIDLYIDAGWLPRNPAISFTEDVYPMLARMSGLQWVNKAFAAVFGHNAPFDFLDKDRIDQINQLHGGTPVDVYKPLRMAIFKIFREQTAHASDPAAWPWLYGDSYGTSPEDDPYRNLALGGERLRSMKSWSEGNFIADWGKRPSPPSTIDRYELDDQPDTLDRAMLDFCAADAFHPGIELTWPMRHLSIYSKSFRIARATQGEFDYGSHLDVDTALGSTGPLHGQFPGSLTRWMLLPWQIDTGGCLAGYEDSLAFDAPSFWPSRVPNHVLAHENYLKVTNLSLPKEERLNAFNQRRSWFAPLNSPGQDWGEHLIQEFGNMGVVEAYPGVGGDDHIPPVIYVETHPGTKDKIVIADAGGVAPASAPASASAADLRAQGAGFADEADRIAVRKMRFGQ
ncbi:LodA/GoxA family CTQ-dependent oxidase [Mesorhizobium sp. M1328]|uniref:LodA/GoxA family CTQ-dependent oxidase n=1 Tax=Mesorhizobium sp. M1328 TaxID=2957082 RepID=UPI00333CE589